MMWAVIFWIFVYVLASDYRCKGGVPANTVVAGVCFTPANAATDTEGNRGK
jgi:hypothetical protein